MSIKHHNWFWVNLTMACLLVSNRLDRIFQKLLILGFSLKISNIISLEFTVSGADRSELTGML